MAGTAWTVDGSRQHFLQRPSMDSSMRSNSATTVQTLQSMQSTQSMPVPATPHGDSLVPPRSKLSNRVSRAGLFGILGRSFTSRGEARDIRPHVRGRRDVKEPVPAAERQQSSVLPTLREPGPQAPNAQRSNSSIEGLERETRPTSSSASSMRKERKPRLARDPLPCLHTSSGCVRAGRVRVPISSVDSIIRSQKAQGKHRTTRTERGLGPSPTYPPAEAVEKYFVLTGTGALLQYGCGGAADRSPEKMIQLSRDSAAIASDAIPGQHWVLQVSGTFVGDGSAAGAPASSLRSRLALSRLGFGALNDGGAGAGGVRPAKHFLMIMAEPDQLNAWLVAVRREIQALGGRDYTPDTVKGLDSPRRTQTSTIQEFLDQEGSSARSSPAQRSPEQRSPKSMPLPVGGRDAGRAGSQSSAAGVGGMGSLPAVHSRGTSHASDESQHLTGSTSQGRSGRSTVDDIANPPRILDAIPLSPFDATSIQPFQTQSQSQIYRNSQVQAQSQIQLKPQSPGDEDENLDFWTHTSPNKLAKRPTQRLSLQELPRTDVELSPGREVGMPLSASPDKVRRFSQRPPPLNRQTMHGSFRTVSAGEAVVLTPPDSLSSSRRSSADTGEDEEDEEDGQGQADGGRGEDEGTSEAVELTTARPMSITSAPPTSLSRRASRASRVSDARSPSPKPRPRSKRHSRPELAVALTMYSASSARAVQIVSTSSSKPTRPSPTADAASSPASPAAIATAPVTPTAPGTLPAPVPVPVRLSSLAYLHGHLPPSAAVAGANIPEPLPSTTSPAPIKSPATASPASIASIGSARLPKFSLPAPLPPPTTALPAIPGSKVPSPMPSPKPSRPPTLPPHAYSPGSEPVAPVHVRKASVALSPLGEGESKGKLAAAAVPAATAPVPAIMQQPPTAKDASPKMSWPSTSTGTSARVTTPPMMLARDVVEATAPAPTSVEALQTRTLEAPLRKQSANSVNLVAVPDIPAERVCGPRHPGASTPPSLSISERRRRRSPSPGKGEGLASASESGSGAGKSGNGSVPRDQSPTLTISERRRSRSPSPGRIPKLRIKGADEMPMPRSIAAMQAVGPVAVEGAEAREEESKAAAPALAATRIKGLTSRANSVGKTDANKKAQNGKGKAIVKGKGNSPDTSQTLWFPKQAEQQTEEQKVVVPGTLPARAAPSAPSAPSALVNAQSSSPSSPPISEALKKEIVVPARVQTPSPPIIMQATITSLGGDDDLFMHIPSPAPSERAAVRPRAPSSVLQRRDPVEGGPRKHNSFAAASCASNKHADAHNGDGHDHEAATSSDGAAEEDGSEVYSALGSQAARSRTATSPRKPASAQMNSAPDTPDAASFPLPARSSSAQPAVRDRMNQPPRPTHREQIKEWERRQARLPPAHPPRWPLLSPRQRTGQISSGGGGGAGSGLPLYGADGGASLVARPLMLGRLPDLDFGAGFGGAGRAGEGAAVDGGGGGQRKGSGSRWSLLGAIEGIGLDEK